MFPMRFSSVFKSRWMALLWAAGILWFAYDVAQSEEPDDNNAASSTQVNQALNSL
jgi:hypothetical protein